MIIKSTKNEQGIIQHEDADSNVTECAAVIGGLSWPTDKSPAYFCVFGQRLKGGRKRQKNKKAKIEFIAEHQGESLSLKQLFLKMTDFTKRFYCETYYTVTGDLYEGYAETFEDYFENKKLDLYPALDDAPFSDNFLFGVQLIDLWREQGTINIPEDTILYRQLREISSDDLGNDPELIFYAINALRFVVGTYLVNNFQPSSYIKKDKPTSFMAA